MLIFFISINFSRIQKADTKWKTEVASIENGHGGPKVMPLLTKIKFFN